MKELTLDKKKALLAEVNKLLATIPDYQLAIPDDEIEYFHIFKFSQHSRQGTENRINTGI